MRQQQQTSYRKMITYRIAKRSWFITAWIWTSIIIVFLTQLVTTLLTTPNVNLESLWVAQVVRWLVNGNTTPIQNLLRLVALGVAFLLMALPLVALLLKQILHDAQPREGIDKLTDVQQEGIKNLIEVLQDDPLFTRLKILLEQQFQQLFQKQDACIKVLERVSVLLQQTPTSSNLRVLHTLSQQQQSLQKDFSDMVHDLRDIQAKTLEQVQRLGNLSEQDQHTQKTILDSLGKISPLLEEMRDRLKTLSSPDRRESGSLSNEQTIPEPVPAVVSSPQADQIGQ